MLARVAEDLYWLGRYLERADNLARMVDVHYSIAPEPDSGDALDMVLFALDASEDFEREQERVEGLSKEDYLVHSIASPISIRSAVANARRLARQLREHLSREVFEEINRLHLDLGYNRGVPALLDVVRGAIPTVLGLFEHTVLRTEGAHWFNVGLYLERADMTSRILDIKYFVPLELDQGGVGSAWDNSQWREVLRSASALEAHQKLHHGVLRVENVVDMLMFEEDFPRSVVYCVESLLVEFQKAAVLTPRGRTLWVTKELTLLDLDLKSSNADQVLISGMHQFIDEVQRRLGTASEDVTAKIFSPEALLEQAQQ